MASIMLGFGTIKSFKKSHSLLHTHPPNCRARVSLSNKFTDAHTLPHPGKYAFDKVEILIYSDNLIPELQICTQL
jgi:hypothetical protein